jgi:hypothetical protein
MTAHQRIIRDEMAREAPQELPFSGLLGMRGYTVEEIDADAARPIIMTYEWLGTIGRSTIFVGLISPTRELEGVACFGHGPSTAIRRVIGSPALCLERGACVHWAPKNAASFLITKACKLVYEKTGGDKHGSTAIFYAYADPMAGEYGGVYQACGWVYLGQGLDNGKTREKRRRVLPPGGDPNDITQWKTTRILRRAGNDMGYDEALAAGWRIEWFGAKHVYAIHVGRYRRFWREAVPSLPYPAPRPKLKLRVLSSKQRLS